MKRVLVGLAWLVASNACMADVVVSIYTSGDAPHDEEIGSSCFTEFGKLHGIEVVAPPNHSDYVIRLAIAESADTVAISAQVVERVDPVILNRFYLLSEYKKQYESASALVNVMAPVESQTEIELGRFSEVQEMCQKIARLVDRGTFLRERQHPRGGSFDAALMNFLERLGGKRRQ